MTTRPPYQIRNFLKELNKDFGTQTAKAAIFAWTDEGDEVHVIQLTLGDSREDTSLLASLTHWFAHRLADIGKAIDVARRN